MSQNHPTKSFAARVLQAGIAVLLVTTSPAWAQSNAVPAIEEIAPALAVDEAALAAAVIGLDESAAGREPQQAKATDSKATSPAVEDYTVQIGSGLKERERRLTLLNEAMMKLREAGETEDAGRVEERIRALLEMPEPSQAGAQLRAEIEKMRAKNDDLIVQMVAMEEELKRYRGTSSSVASRKNSSR